MESPRGRSASLAICLQASARAALMLDLFSFEQPTSGRPRSADELQITKFHGAHAAGPAREHRLTGAAASASLPSRLADARPRADDAGDERVSRRCSPRPPVGSPASFGGTVRVAASERGSVLYVATSGRRALVSAPAVPVAADLTPTGSYFSPDRGGRRRQARPSRRPEQEYHRRRYAGRDPAAVDGVPLHRRPAAHGATDRRPRPWRFSTPSDQFE